MLQPVETSDINSKKIAAEFAEFGSRAAMMKKQQIFRGINLCN